MEKRFLKAFVWVFIVIVGFNILGCAVGFHRRHPKDIEKIKVLSERLEELRRTKAQLERQLQKEIARGDVQLQMGDRGLVVTVVDEVLFDSGKAKVKPEGKKVLGKVANVLANVNEDIAIEGHTDNVKIRFSGWKSNWELSAHRALNVLHYFVDEKGLIPERFSAAGYGEYKPVASNDTKEGRQKNRRVEIIILSAEIEKTKATPKGEPSVGVEKYIK